MLIVDFKASFTASEDIPAGSRVKYVAGGGVALAGAAEKEVGIAILHSGKSSYASGSQVGVQLRALPVLCQAAGAFADGAAVQRMASGLVDDAGSGATYGIATEAAAALGDLIQVIPLATGGTGAIPADIATADATDLATAEALANACKAKINALLAALR